MSLFASPEEHAANPPETWTATKTGSGRWALLTLDGTKLDSYETKREALAATRSGFYVDLYAIDSRWYAGEQIPNRLPWDYVQQLRQISAKITDAPVVLTKLNWGEADVEAAS